MSSSNTMYRKFIFSITALLLTCACGSVRPIWLPPVLPTSSPTAHPSTPVPDPQATIQTSWLSQLEIIGPQNWSRLQLLQTFPAEMPMDYSAVTISPDGKTLVVGSSNSAQLVFLDIESGKFSGTMNINGVWSADEPFQTIEYLADGTLMANSSSPYAIYHIDSAGNVLTRWDGIDFAVSTDDKTVAFGENEGTPLVDIASTKTLMTLNEINSYGYSFSTDDSKISMDIVTVEDLSVAIWDLASQSPLITLPDAGNSRYSPNGKFLAVVGYEDEATTLKIFQPDGSAQIATLKVSEPHGLTGIKPVLSPDGLIVASQISNGGLPTAWDTTNWQPLEAPSLQGDLGSFSPDGRILITRAPDGGIFIWGVLP